MYKQYISYHLSIHQTIYQTRDYSSSYHGRTLLHHLTCGSTTLEFETHSFPAKLAVLETINNCNSSVTVTDTVNLRILSVLQH
jgi:hypothetical protein